MKPPAAQSTPETIYVKAETWSSVLHGRWGRAGAWVLRAGEMQPYTQRVGESGAATKVLLDFAIDLLCGLGTVTSSL